MSARINRRTANKSKPVVEEIDEEVQDVALLDQEEDSNPVDLSVDGVVRIDDLIRNAKARAAQEGRSLPVEEANDEDEESGEIDDEEPEEEPAEDVAEAPVDDEEDDEILEEMSIAPVAPTPAPVKKEEEEPAKAPTPVSAKNRRRQVVAPVDDEPEEDEEPEEEPAAPVSAKNRRRQIVAPVEEEEEPAKAPTPPAGRRRLAPSTEDEENESDVVEKTDTRKDVDRVAPVENRRKLKRETDEAPAAQSAPTPKNDASGSASGGLFARRAAAKAAAAAASAPASKPVKETKKDEAPVESLMDKYRRIVDEDGPLAALDEIFPNAAAVNRVSQGDFETITNNIAGILGFVRVMSKLDDDVEVVTIPESPKKGKKTIFTHACVLYGSCYDQNEKPREDSKPFALAKDAEFISEEEFDIGFYALHEDFAGRDIFALIKKAIFVARARK